MKNKKFIGFGAAGLGAAALVSTLMFQNKGTTEEQSNSDLKSPVLIENQISDSNPNEENIKHLTSEEIQKIQQDLNQMKVYSFNTLKLGRVEVYKIDTCLYVHSLSTNFTYSPTNCE